MQIKLFDSQKEKLKTNIEIVFVKNLNKLKENTKELNELNFGKDNSKILLSSAKKYYVFSEVLNGEELKILVSSVLKDLRTYNFKNIKISLVSLGKELKLKTLVEGILLGSYSFSKYKSKKDNKLASIFIDIRNSKKPLETLESELNKITTICKAVNLAKNIVNTTPEDYYPKVMSEEAKKIAKENDLDCKIYGEDYLKEKGMNVMLAVGRASRHESQLIHLTYKPKKSLGKVVLVGKGLTYDAGGLSLKSPLGMISMKCDKAGGSSVLGIMSALKSLDYPYEVHGIVGAVENMIGGDAFKPDDVLIAKNGTSIEVRNTDAEGRLVLADCLCYAQDEIKDIDYMFDMATLTGACIIALGNYTIGVMGHNNKLKNKMQKASNSSGEFIGFLPYNRYLPSLIKSGIADITNSTASKAGASITASLFLDKFVKKTNKKKWLHLDIAGPAYSESPWGYNSFGATGAGVRLILKFIEKLK